MNPLFKTQEKDNSIHIRIDSYDKDYEFPKEDIIFIEQMNSSCEELSEYFMREFVNILPPTYLKDNGIYYLKFGVSESHGQMGLTSIHF